MDKSGQGVVSDGFITGRILALALIVACAVGCGGNGSNKNEESSGPPVTIVDAVRAEARDVQVGVRSVGSLEAVDRVEIAPEIPGIVKRIHFEENQKVKQGDILLELDERKLSLAVQQAEDALRTAEAQVELARATIRRAEADVENRRSMFERDKRLFDDGIASEAVFVQSKTALDSAEAAVAEAQAQYRSAEKQMEAAKTTLALAREGLADTRIVAPLSGILAERLVSTGDYVKAGNTLVELVVMDPLEISFTVPEKYGGRIRVGQTVLFNSPSLPERTFTGKTTYLGPTADPNTRSIKLKALVSNEEGLLQPGLFGNVNLVLEIHPNAPVIPESAVVPREEESFIYVVGNSEAQLRKVVLGEYMADAVEILDGVAVGEIVITAGQQKVADGYPVRVRGSLEEQGGRKTADPSQQAL